ncbi:hypothetical protein DPMN_091628 [Dreissena polymorpha]|uniref:Uncharacterized protein n=1 Tax=Dreissena polymorpha TaxID=45954 RepID=A0A9D4KZV9_DREPO|nr:hypothetical protein DPMN_091628 [Dreissena polymorpha]
MSSVNEVQRGCTLKRTKRNFLNLDLHSPNKQQKPRATTLLRNQLTQRGDTTKEPSDITQPRDRRDANTAPKHNHKSPSCQTIKRLRARTHQRETVMFRNQLKNADKQPRATLHNLET